MAGGKRRKAPARAKSVPAPAKRPTRRRKADAGEAVDVAPKVELVDLPTDVIHRIFACLRPTDDETQRRVRLCNSVVHPLHDGYESADGIVYQRALLALRSASRRTKELVDQYVDTVAIDGSFSARRWCHRLRSHHRVNSVGVPFGAASLFRVFRTNLPQLKHLHMFDVEPSAASTFATWLETVATVLSTDGVQPSPSMCLLSQQLGNITDLRVSIWQPLNSTVEHFLASVRFLPSLRHLSLRVGQGNVPESKHLPSKLEQLPELPALQSLHLAGIELAPRAVKDLVSSASAAQLESLHVAVSHTTTWNAFDEHEQVFEFQAAGAGSALRELHILQAGLRTCAQNHVHVEMLECCPNISRIWPGACKGLREVQIHHRFVDDGALEALTALAPTLESLVVRDWLVLGSDAAEIISAEDLGESLEGSRTWGVAQATKLATLTKLTRLELSICACGASGSSYFHSDADGQMDATEALVILATGLRALETFRFEDVRRGSIFRDDALAAFGELPRLKTLILGHSCNAPHYDTTRVKRCFLTADGFKALAAGRPPLQHLEVVNMRYMPLDGPHAAAALKALDGLKSTLRQLRLPRAWLEEPLPEAARGLGRRRSAGGVKTLANTHLSQALRRSVDLVASRAPDGLERKRFGNYAWDLGPNPQRDLGRTNLMDCGSDRGKQTPLDPNDYDDADGDCESLTALADGSSLDSPLTGSDDEYYSDDETGYTGDADYAALMGTMADTFWNAIHPPTNGPGGY
ncbi:unnamed protein product [Pedinophyceae sp. YPF-701]|nr:unnamed protein product [Pedinophyceae sp. YPF-701]